jgi:hypothetical protein
LLDVRVAVLTYVVDLDPVERSSMKDSLTMDVSVRFQHSWWRILLIVLAVAAFITTCVFNGLASGGPNGMNEY